MKRLKVLSAMILISWMSSVGNAATFDWYTYEGIKRHILTKIVNLGMSQNYYHLGPCFLITDAEPNVTNGPYSFGEVFIRNMDLNKGLPDQEARGFMKCDVEAKESPAGTIMIRWNPSQSIYKLIDQVVRLYLDNASYWPRFTENLLPKKLKPYVPGVVDQTPHTEYLKIEWENLGVLLEPGARTIEMDFLSMILRGLRVLNPVVDKVDAEGTVTYYGDTDTNTTILEAEIDSVFPDALKCHQKIKTNYNPVSGVTSSEPRPVKAQVRCGFPNSKIPEVPLP